MPIREITERTPYPVGVYDIDIKAKKELEKILGVETVPFGTWEWWHDLDDSPWYNRTATPCILLSEKWVHLSYIPYGKVVNGNLYVPLYVPTDRTI